MRKRCGLRWLGFVGGVVLSTMSAVAAPSFKAIEELPASWRPAYERAQSAFRTLQQRLQERLSQELAQQGPAASVRVCKEEAMRITRAVQDEGGVVLGRTSHRLRNPANQPPLWAAEWVRASARKAASEVAPVWIDLGEKLGVLAPIPTGSVCLVCHGEPASLDPELQATLRALYPQDQAVGFRLGELRGFFWAEVEKPSASADPAARHDR